MDHWRQDDNIKVATPGSIFALLDPKVMPSKEYNGPAQYYSAFVSLG